MANAMKSYFFCFCSCLLLSRGKCNAANDHLQWGLCLVRYWAVPFSLLVVELKCSSNRYILTVYFKAEGICWITCFTTPFFHTYKNMTMCINICYSIHLDSWFNACQNVVFWYIRSLLPFVLPSFPLSPVCICAHTSENKEAVSDKQSDFLGKKIWPVTVNNLGCPRWDWKSGTEIVQGFGEC